MNGELIRLGVVMAVMVCAVVVGRTFTRMSRPAHPPVLVGSEGDRPGVVLFTSTTCATCTETITFLRDSGVAYREITYDLEPQRFDQWGIVAVPVTIVIDGNGVAVGTFTGVPSDRALRKALGAARIGSVE